MAFLSAGVFIILCYMSFVCERTMHGNNMNMRKQPPAFTAYGAERGPVAEGNTSSTNAESDDNLGFVNNDCGPS